jgi:hypothetical protein
MLIFKTKQMKNLKYLILTISSLFLLTSCDRELDINPEIIGYGINFIHLPKSTIPKDI